MSRRNRRKGSGGQAGRPPGKPDNDQRSQKGKPETPKADESQKAGNRSTKANMVVLVDDDPDYVEMESLAVVNYISGYNPMGFTDPGRALNYITNPRNENRIGLVLLNLEIPDSDGHSVGEVLDMLAKKREIPLAAVSSHNSGENVARVLKIGAVGLLPKAFTLEVFVRFVKGILRNGHSSAWQCTACGKLVGVEQIDMLNMRPIKCADKSCDSARIDEVVFKPKR